MDDVRIYGRELSAPEIGNLYAIGLPAPDIVANGSDGPLSISQTDTLTLSVSLDPGILAGVNADWWGLAETPFGMFHYNIASRSWVPGMAPTRQGPLSPLESLEVMLMRDLPVGSYTTRFGVDPIMNGVFDIDDLFMDSVEINVTP